MSTDEEVREVEHLKKMLHKRKKVIVWVERPLTKEQRKNFKKENPGFRLSFRLRYPNFPETILIISLLLVTLKPVLIDMLQWLQKWL